VERWRWKRSER